MQMQGKTNQPMMKLNENNCKIRSNGKEWQLVTLSACLRQSMRLILPFWSGLERTHMAGFLPVMLSTKSSRHSCVMSLRSLPSRRDAHFCFTSAFSFCNKQTKKNQTEIINIAVQFPIYSLSSQFMLQVWF